MKTQDALTHAATLAARIDPHRTAPNPRVGCITVKNGKIISQGVHEFFGGPHAEANACKDINDLSDAEVFITLEPCHDFVGKKTPSCAQLLLNLKPKKIWVGALDPQFQGKNIAYLKSQGINIEYYPNKECEALNPFFKTWITEKRPHVTLKIAQSLNGKITSSKKNITNNASRQIVHQMRAEHSAILTTTETILRDNPQLNIRLQKNLVHPSSAPALIVLGKRKLQKNLNIFRTLNRQVYFLEELENLKQLCREKKIDSIMTECGGVLNTLLLEKGLVDEVKIFISSQLLKQNEKNSFTSEINLSDFKIKMLNSLENDLLLSYVYLAD